MDKASLIAKIETIAKITVDDELSNRLSRLASRLETIGAPFEKPLTKSEVALLSEYV